MLIVCPHCQKEHNIQENKIPSNAKVAKCKVCGNTFNLLENIKPKKPEATLKTQTRSLSIALTKGGVGKSTTAVNLAAGLAHNGYKVLLVDTDTQGQVSFMLGVKPPGGLTEFLTGELPYENAVFKAREKLWILAGGRSLAGIKRMIDRKDFGGELTLAESLRSIENGYDFVIVDTSPGWDTLTVNVLFYVKEILVPVSLEIMTFQGLIEFQKNVAAIKKYRQELELKYILPTFLDMRVKKKADNFLERLEKRYSNLLCPPLRYNNALSQTPMYGKTIFEYAPGSRGSEDYRKLVSQITAEDKAKAAQN